MAATVLVWSCSFLASSVDSWETYEREVKEGVRAV
jgi:hypothetical protein